MGLLLSTLVFCVGVIELITFYRNVRRHVQYPPPRGSLSHIRKGYIQELRSTRRKLIEDIEKLKEVAEQASTNIVPDNYVLKSIPTFRLNSHEDIEIEYSESLARSRSPSPRRLLVTENDQHDKHSASCRRFIISEEPQAIRKSKSQSSLPEFLIKEQPNSPKSPDTPRYILQEQQGTSARPIPLPRQFIVTESELDTIVFDDSKIKKTTNKVEYVRRSSSPFPPLELPQGPRNSLCNDVIEYSSLDSVQEEQKSRSVSPNTVIENLAQRAVVICGQQESTEVVLAKTVEALCSDDVEKQLASSIHERNAIISPKSKIELDLEEALEENVSLQATTASNSSSNISRKNVSSPELEVNNQVPTGSDLAGRVLENKTLATPTTADNLANGGAKKKEPEAFWVKSVE